MTQASLIARSVLALALSAAACQQAPAPQTPQAPPAAQTPAVTPASAAARPAGVDPNAPLRAHVWTCDDGSTLHTSNAADANAIVLHLPDGDRRLPQVPAASGVKYEDAATLFWTKGTEATFERRPGGVLTCREQRALSLVADARARGVTFRGHGNEPGWLLEVGPADTVTFEDRYGESRVTYTDVTTAKAADGATTYSGTHTAGTIRVTLRQQPCQDSMSGDGFPTTVKVLVNGERQQGCGTSLERQR